MGSRGMWRDPLAAKTCAREPPSAGPVLLVVGLVALFRALTVPMVPDPLEVGIAVDIRLESLEGDAFRLLPGVGPVLAKRLEMARKQAGGVLHYGDLSEVKGVGPVRLKQWGDLWGLAGEDPLR